MFDSYVGFGLADLLVPFASHWKPMAVAWGVTGLYLLLAVEVSSLARKRLPNRIWRRLHFLAFPLYVVATLHMLTAGTDAAPRPSRSWPWRSPGSRSVRSRPSDRA